LTTAETGSPAPARTRGEVFEGIGFTFCRAATIILITQWLALPVAAGATALFYLLAIRHGQTSTRCLLRRPALVAAFWGAVFLVSLYTHVWPRVRPLLGADARAAPAVSVTPGRAGGSPFGRREDIVRMSHSGRPGPGSLR
jgi:hypothetical protein